MITYKQGLLFLALLSMASTVRAGTSFDLDLKELDQQKTAQPHQKEKQTSFDLDVKELERQKKGQPHQKEKRGSFDLDLKELDRQKAAQPRKKGEQKRRSAKAAPAAGRSEKVQQSPAVSPEYFRYTIRPGDHIFKILVARLGMSNEAAESLIPSILRLNHISDIKQLKVGSTLLIPGKGSGKGTEGAAKTGEAQKGATESREAAPPQAAPTHPLGSEASRAHELHPAPPAEVQKGPASAAPVSVAPKAAVPAADVAPPSKASAPAAPASKAAAAAAPVVAAPPKTAPHAAPVAAAPKASAAAPKASAAAPAAAVRTPVAALPTAVTWICSVTESEPSRIVDSLLNALSISWSKNRIIESGEGAPTAFSIRVDRYFEYKGGRYIVSIGKNDPYSYTLLGLLESTGYRVLRIGGGEDFKLVGERLLTLIGVARDFGRHPLQEGNACTGFLVQQDDAGGRRVVLTRDAAGSGQKWVMAPGCGAK